MLRETWTTRGQLLRVRSLLSKLMTLGVTDYLPTWAVSKYLSGNPHSPGVHSGTSVFPFTSRLGHGVREGRVCPCEPYKIILLYTSTRVVDEKPVYFPVDWVWPLPTLLLYSPPLLYPPLYSTLHSPICCVSTNLFIVPWCVEVEKSNTVSMVVTSVVEREKVDSNGKQKDKTSTVTNIPLLPILER